MKRQIVISPSRTAFAVLLALAQPASTSVSAPRVHIGTMAELPVVERKPYDEHANANEVVAAAFTRARNNHKRVLIDLGGNWCTDCIVLANIMQLPEVKRFVAAHYEVAVVDVGRFNRNLQIPARFGIARRLEGVPSVLVVEANGRLVNAGHTAALADARHLTPQGIADWLALWAN